MSGIIAKNASRSSGIIGPVAGSGSTNNSVDTMTGDASDTTLSLSQTPGSENNVQITFDGVTQHHSTFSLSGSTITFSTAPAIGVLVEAVSGAASTTGTPDDGTVTLAKMTANNCDSDQYVDGSIDLAHIATNQIDETLMKDAFVGDFSDVTVTAADTFLYGDATDSGNTKKDTVQGVLDLVPSSGFTLGTEQATTSGTGVTFGSIPTGTTMIIINFEGVGVDGTDETQIELGDAGGLETSGYVGGSADLDNDNTINAATLTTAFYIKGGGTDVLSGSAYLALKDSTNNTWAWSHNINARGSSGACSVGGFTKSLSAVLTQLKISPTGSDNHDAGSINIMYI
jgi:hypothetical protein